ncbi:hypothetical protein CGRA01v4_03361 [Colletotrichum graminicola]|nr:hypothetical protein CGRA01v4_03361 [Colletotrichum graminicola]
MGTGGTFCFSYFRTGERAAQRHDSLALVFIFTSCCLFILLTILFFPPSLVFVSSLHKNMHIVFSIYFHPKHVYRVILSSTSVRLPYPSVLSVCLPPLNGIRFLSFGLSCPDAIPPPTQHVTGRHCLLKDEPCHCDCPPTSLPPPLLGFGAATSTPFASPTIPGPHWITFTSRHIMSPSERRR